ncbi:PLDc N-terminal domain-containing protein [Paenarthrobacter sp. NPDC056912]|uniref:PLDc N-terminal domain-containing protein n=1 Tax=Paenarthrobacter sp. NPDC056912 TaxID=3345965 RepID=UPI0036725E7E
MESWQWLLVLIAGLPAVFVMGAVIWGVLDVLKDDRLDQTARVLWVLLLFVLPLFGILAWLYARPRLTGLADGFRLTAVPSVS